MCLLSPKLWCWSFVCLLVLVCMFVRSLVSSFVSLLRKSKVMMITSGFIYVCTDSAMYLCAKLFKLKNKFYAHIRICRNCHFYLKYEPGSEKKLLSQKLRIGDFDTRFL